MWSKVHASDIISQKTIKETFALNEVPREAFFVGLAGVVPYLATSASTVYLAWDINHAAMDGQGFLLSGETAELLLHIIEPLQIGYGAVVSVHVRILETTKETHISHRSSPSWVLSTGG